ncbi:hypothetical protein C8J56DRAFT_139703 [Mycena floridula]|nr:hypothetical protein C8J56DRAFT_139703 [Mycena floridula]
MTSVPHPSLSRDVDSPLPPLIHSLHEVKSSVLSLAANDEHIFSGNQNSDIAVWDKRSFSLKKTLQGHSGSVLALVYAADKQWLLSSSGDSTIRIWSTDSLSIVHVLDPHLETGAGDLFSLAWSPSLQTIYVGCQNTSLQWYTFEQHRQEEEEAETSTPESQVSVRKAHKFFDSYPQYERRPADIYANNSGTATPIKVPSFNEHRLQIPPSNVIDSAHYGYIYCMTLLEDNDTQLVTGGGDEIIKLWDCSQVIPERPYKWETCCGAIYSIIARGETIYAGCQDGLVKVIDRETKTIIRTIMVQEGVDILSMSMINSELYTCSADGRLQRYSASFDCTASWASHDGIVLSSIIAHDAATTTTSLITGGNDDYIRVWDIAATNPPPLTDDAKEDTISLDGATHHTMVYALSKFVAIPSVSSSPSHREDCRQAAIWLKKCLSQLGAQSSLLPTGENTNPLVFATFSGTDGTSRKPRVLFYGHYDVISAPREGWNSDPFAVAGKNGYLYGRGVTDNKGPIMAVAFAAAGLLHSRALDVDLVFLIEGEEECGSAGFENAVRKHKEMIGHVDAILVSNSTWIAEEPPCITYGLRGVVHCALEISNNLPDLHSGIDGGGVAEPMLDMVALLATLTDSNRHVKIPGFYDSVRPQTDAEKELYQRLGSLTQQSASSLSSRWREPSLTVHNIEISGPKNATVIPGTVKAQVSLRIVPDQDLQTIIDSLTKYLNTSFQQLNSPNQLKLIVEHTADWWLGDFDDPWFQCLESAVRDEWHIDPLRIREGGSIPSVPYLEKEFKCHALHLPLGQSMDRAHLPNERISLTNLHRGKSVIERFLHNVAAKSPSAIH